LFESTLFLIALAFSWLPSHAFAEAVQSESSAVRAAPQISGRLIGTDGERRVLLEYKAKAGNATFIGDLRATCVIPARTAAVPTPLALSQVPKGSSLTIFYVRHAIMTKRGRKIEHVILAVRFDRASPSLGIGKGETLSCYKSGPVPPSK
jgi:hypothetical protein